MTRLGRRALRLLPGLWAVWLAASLALLSVSPAPIAGDAAPALAAYGAGLPDGAGHCCHGGDGGDGSSSGACSAVQHACAACSLAVLAVPTLAGIADRGRVRHLPRGLVPRAMTGPQVPHGPPRFA